MADAIDLQLKRAAALGRAMLDSEPRAVAARYEPATRRIVIELTNGCSYAFPAALVEDLRGAWVMRTAACFMAASRLWIASGRLWFTSWRRSAMI